MRNSKPSNNVPQDESLRIHVLDVSEGLDFHPFGNVVCANEEPSSVPYSPEKRFHYIQALLSE